MAESLQAAPVGADAPPAEEEAVFLLRWLAALFAAPPSTAQVESYRSGDGAAVLEILAGQADLAPSVNAIRHALGGGATAAQASAAITTAFNLLFAGLGGPRTVPPYESAFTSERGLLFQKATSRMERLLDALGLVSSGLPGEPADHLSLELEAMAELIRRGDAERLAVLSDQLAAWVPAFCALIDERDRQGFYAGLATLLAAAMQRHSSIHIPASEISQPMEASPCQTVA